MSDSSNIVISNNDKSVLQLLQDVCGVTEARAQELLEAGGSTERAIDIFFSHQPQVATTSSHLVASNKKRKERDNIASSSRSNDTRPHPTLFLDHSKRTQQQQQQSPHDPRLDYLALATCLAEMTGTTKRLAKLSTLKLFFKQTIEAVGGMGVGTEASRAHDGTLFTQAMCLLLGCPGVTLNVSWSAVSKAVMTVTGASSTQLRQAYQSSGDYGDAAATFMRKQRLLITPRPWTIEGVYSILQKISKCEGKNSQAQRHALMVKLLQSCKSEEIRFLVRTLLGNMRLGASLKTVLTGLAMAVDELYAGTNDTGTASTHVQDTYDMCPRIDKICLALLVGGILRMKQTCVLEVGTCINPMLANPAHSLDEIEAIMSNGGPIIAEWKYDGVRCQAHWDGTEMKLFSRHMIENTEQFPDAVKFLLDAKNEIVTSFIIDAEIVGVDSDETGSTRLLPFQDLSTRKGPAKMDNNVTICIFAFDLLYLNGDSLIKVPLYERQNSLRNYFSKVQGFQFALAMSLCTYDEVKVQAYLKDAIHGGAEGLMVKLSGLPTEKACPFTCHYESGVRSHTWLKVKRDYIAGFSDTIDVVPIGAWYGSGRKAERNFLSPVLLAVYDDEEEVYKSISRCMTFTDAMYESTREFYLRGTPYPTGTEIVEGLSNVTTVNDDDESVSDECDKIPSRSSNQEDPSTFDCNDRVNCYLNKPNALLVTNECPPIWFKPLEVWEVSYADLSLSNQHTAAQGLVDPVRGVALRFPRFKRRRPDKGVDQATTCQQILELFAKQSKIANSSSRLYQNS